MDRLSAASERRLSTDQTSSRDPRSRPPRLGSRSSWQLPTLAFVAFLATALPAVEDAPVLDIFDRRCSECHGADLKKPKGHFGYVLDLPRLAADPLYVIPGEPQESELYLLLISPDPDDRMPPPDSEHSGTMTAAEIATIEAWIRQLAEPTVEPQEASADEATQAVTSEEPVIADGPAEDEDYGDAAGHAPAINDGQEPPAADESPATANSHSWQKTLGLAHLLVLHFPIALLIVLVPSQLWTLSSRCPPQRRVDRFLLWTGTLGAAVAVVTGLAAADSFGYRDSSVATHRNFAWATLAAAALATICHEIQIRSGRRSLAYLECLCVIAAAVCAGLAGHHGGELVHDETLF